ncbi:hypothetical protein Pan216_47680 [Planctomycetes bacterium Pan216]|uniref:Translational regulator CsrA n=1 Tax=Kolteria novifilia TaxID=2527975 RepID=A0A518BAC2_9BACT|nr:hypothetical protein Pan216_47680 [Planctomycetes bacterium Pan216]
MLVLTRRERQAIEIGYDIKVTVLSVRGNKVRIGIEAPGDCPIRREEIIDIEAGAEAELALV